jgi:hypothetical protein
MRLCTNLRRIEKKIPFLSFFFVICEREGFFCFLFENSMSLPFCFFLLIRFLFQFKGKSEKMCYFCHSHSQFFVRGDKMHLFAAKNASVHKFATYREKKFLFSLFSFAICERGFFLFFI